MFHPKQEMSDRKKIGPLGEELVVKFLVKQGYEILDRNYRRPWGELDIVARKKNKIHFVEVKALSSSVIENGVTHETSPELGDGARALAYIHSGIRKDRFRPEDNMSKGKMLRLSRIIQTYLMGKHVSDETHWQFDVATVLINTGTKKAKIKFLDDLPIRQS